MNKREKEVFKAQLDAEEAVLKELEKQYQKALNDINRKIMILQSDELTQSRIYRIEYQKALKGQVEAILEKLRGDEFTTLQQYLHDSYTDAFIGAVYDMHGQGVPLIMPIDQAAAVKAIQMDSKINEGLYESLGVDSKKLKKTISNEITRGIAEGMSNNEIARNITFATKAPLSRAKTIARTESHRITQASTFNAQKSAKAKGADVVKQWDSTMDGDTRPTHRKLDGQIRELDEPFEMDGKKAMYPGDFGDPAEDCNCHCVSLQRAKWALDEGELETLKERAKFFGLDKTEDFQDFKKKYLNTTKTLEKVSKNGKIDLGIQFFASKEKQFGKKVGKHAIDFGLDPSSADDRAKFLEIVNDIKDNATELRIGEWRGQAEEVIFHIKGEDVVITNQSDEFITVLKGGVSNERVKRARKHEI